MKTRLAFIIWIFLSGTPMLLTAQYIGSHLTKENIEEFGTKTFSASQESVYNAVRATFIDHDYDIGVENKEKGEIRTRRKVQSAHGNSHQAAFYYRQYIATITEKEPGKTTVVLTPKYFNQETDISDKRCWVLKGKMGELKLWESMFQGIQEQLK
jgi:hypothetical protein